jgi:hypothetical protein
MVRRRRSSGKEERIFFSEEKKQKTFALLSRIYPGTQSNEAWEAICAQARWVRGWRLALVRALR